MLFFFEVDKNAYKRLLFIVLVGFVPAVIG